MAPATGLFPRPSTWPPIIAAGPCSTHVGAPVMVTVISVRSSSGSSCKDLRRDWAARRRAWPRRAAACIRLTMYLRHQSVRNIGNSSVRGKVDAEETTSPRAALARSRVTPAGAGSSKPYGRLCRNLTARAAIFFALAANVCFERDSGMRQVGSHNEKKAHPGNECCRSECSIRSVLTLALRLRIFSC